ncbi:Mob1 family protein [Verticillium alfalfae VaMs.102]|uniref:Mob1 family protein n=1 Tax=Verticillium alfalfae (strain VaMs.102 / ATCC MYA-4576 / FGSC 10136) TaxID=526221 RepID=C9S8N8_VERA1|nr:Mob1 family protein [Verticillium alfalfae VaMs.102]EEY14930.1 Mob1 family protein [Verticillium alfalfae VaMs.102]
MALAAPPSPRLPSPPPAAEDQIGPPSPSMGAQANRQAAQLEKSIMEANAKRRIHPGTKAQDMATGPPLVPLNELDSAFQLQEHLAALHHFHTNGGAHGITRQTAIQLATPPPSIDRTLWLYELCRFLISQCNTLIVGFLFDAPPCSASTCPEMRASEWQFLCAVHEQPKSCCAIDYCCHTLDWAANVVTDPKIFPSRFVVSSDAHNKSVAVKNLVNVFRRLHRIFAHAWFQHRAVFWNIEGQTGLYVFFKTVCDMYDLLPAENYKLPPEPEGLETNAAASDPSNDNDDQGSASGKQYHPHNNTNSNNHHQQPAAISIAKPPSRGGHDDIGAAADENYQSIGRTNTRRHIRASPSTGSAVTTVLETDEEDHDVTSRLREMCISAAPDMAEEAETADVPVIVAKEVMDDASPPASPPENDRTIVEHLGAEPEEDAPPTSEPQQEDAAHPETAHPETEALLSETAPITEEDKAALESVDAEKSALETTTIMTAEDRAESADEEPAGGLQEAQDKVEDPAAAEEKMKEETGSSTHKFTKEAVEESASTAEAPEDTQDAEPEKVKDEGAAAVEEAEKAEAQVDSVDEGSTEEAKTQKDSQGESTKEA